MLIIHAYLSKVILNPEAICQAARVLKILKPLSVADPRERLGGPVTIHSTATGLLSDKELTEIKENATRILESCDGKCLELQRFKKVYRDTFGKRFLTPKKLEKVKSALDDVIFLEQVGKKINIKLRNQAEKRSDSAESSQSVSDNLNESAAAVENEPSLGDTTSVLTPQKPALSPISAAACKVSNLLPLPLLPLPTQLNGKMQNDTRFNNTLNI